MKTIAVLSAPEQVAADLKKRIMAGELQGEMPGVAQLARELGINAKVIAPALQILEGDGVLVNRGLRRSRLINPSLIKSDLRKEKGQLQLGIFLYETSDRNNEIITQLEQALVDAGHTVYYPEKTLTDLKMELTHVQRVVRSKTVDAWIVVAGGSEVLHWFSEQATPAFALFGRRFEVALPSIGPEIEKAFNQAVNHLVSQGHQRIVKICRSERRRPHPGKAEREFLATLRAHQISTGDYNLPDWTETPEGFHQLLESLFGVTPPTALILDDVSFFIAAFQFLAGKGLKVPEDVSIIVEKVESKFLWCQPTLAHLSWEIPVLVRHIVRWASKVNQGIDDLECSSVSAEFVAGGTVGPVFEVS